MGRATGNLIALTHAKRSGRIETERKDSRRLSQMLRPFPSGVLSPPFAMHPPVRVPLARLRRRRLVRLVEVHSTTTRMNRSSKERF